MAEIIWTSFRVQGLPVTPNWAAGNSAQLAKWRPGQAIGVMGGKVAVVDVDPRNGGDVGRTRQMLDGLGVRLYAVVETPGPGGGRHFYVGGIPSWPGAHNLTGWPGIDIQSFGSLLFLPGTQRPKWGGAGYKIIFDNLEALADGGDPDGAAALAGWAASATAAMRISSPHRFGTGERPLGGRLPICRR